MTTQGGNADGDGCATDLPVLSMHKAHWFYMLGYESAVIIGKRKQGDTIKYPNNGFSTSFGKNISRQLGTL